MIVPGLELDQILKGDVGETTTQGPPPRIGDELWIRRSRRSLPACRATVLDVWAVPQGFSVLLTKVTESFTVPQKSSEGPRLPLTRRQRQGLFDGTFPAIVGVGECPVGAGDVVHLSSRVSLEVKRIDVKNGKWTLRYEVRDRRDSVHLLRRTPPAHRAGDELDIEDEGAIREAAEQSFYTAEPRSAVADAGEAPDREWVEMRTKTVREFDHQRRLARHAEKMRERSKAHTKRKKAA